VILGLGIDVVDVHRLATALARTPRLAARLFTEREVGLPAESLAGRLAAKEAAVKALGATQAMSWHDFEIVNDAGGRPRLVVSRAAAETAAAMGIRFWHLSVSHDAGVATAVVVAEA
jgi:holo-[acyl-carrier protein] synthase